MRYESSLTSVSWIPSAGVPGLSRDVFNQGVTHYDAPPPTGVRDIDDLDELRRDDRFRFANHLRAWIEVVDGRIVAYGQGGEGVMGNTTVRLGRRMAMTFTGVAFDDIRRA